MNESYQKHHQGVENTIHNGKHFQQQNDKLNNVGRDRRREETREGRFDCIIAWLLHNYGSMVHSHNGDLSLHCIHHTDMIFPVHIRISNNNNQLLLNRKRLIIIIPGSDKQHQKETD